ncbi:MAG: hypothetical protein J7500_11680 [Sphingomonas sp.]|uniref:sensor histidine kinase n=1 Tax=Sphingomonas sp. TaxID=28214 RepID=UPI001B015639|nr:ATP-binding protein [Sphingomonas sp.]MBO9623360.1 hypothetical protein [Sphingomonas sp.]
MPSPVSEGEGALYKVESERLPFWSAHQAWTLVGAASLSAALIAGALILDADGHHAAAWLIVVAAGAASFGFFYRSWKIDLRMRSDLARARREYADLFGRAGISIWKEDWSPVGKAFARLRQAGVEDVTAWYAARPEEARALHAEVMITDVNRYSLELMRAGSEEQLTGSLAAVLPGSARAFGRWLEALERGDQAYVGESVIQRCDGEPFDCLVTAALPRRPEELREVIVSILDVTAYKRDQTSLANVRDEIARTQRIATVGALTASIAHEVNSPLAAISSNAAACLRWLDRPEPDLDEARQAAAAAIAEAERARAVIDRTRAYLQRDERKEETAEVRTLVRESVRLVERQAHSHGISISLNLATDLGSIRCEPIPLQQAMVNILLNAIQAMADIETERRLAVTAAHGADGIRIAVEDTGPGFAQEDMRRIFEPFYSTKGGGMGMGLSICRTTIEAHGGSLLARSEPGAGATFTIALPKEVL